MLINSNYIISVTDANKNFSKATRIAEDSGQVYLLKNNKVKYVLYDLDLSPQLEMTDHEKIEFVARKILKKHLDAFKELAK